MQNEIPGRWLMIVNPNAGVKKGTKAWPVILHLLGEQGIAYDFRITNGRGDATVIAGEAALNGYRSICAVGGDGTLNEVLNGIMDQGRVPVSEITLGMIPVGTGNDWCRMFSIPFDYLKAIQLLKRRKTFLQDVGKVSFQHGNEQVQRYFLNVAGMGYDALVAKRTNLLKEKGLGGTFTYMYFVFASLLQYKFIEAVVEVDGKEVYSGGIFSMNVGICKYNGGGMMQVPAAVPDDGLLDVTIIRKSSKWMVVRHAGKLFDGSLVNLPMVETFQGENIRILSTGKVFLETDGESLGHTPLTFAVLPRCLKIVTGG